MLGNRLLTIATALFAAGLLSAVAAMHRYSDAYTWVSHTSDVRLVIGRAIGHAGGAPSCTALRADIAELASVTADNPAQYARLPELHARVDAVCAGQPSTGLVELLAGLDATERELMAIRRQKLASVRSWTLVALVFAGATAFVAVVLGQLLQRRAMHEVLESEERFRMLASSSLDLVRIHDASGRPRYVSPSVEHILGYTPAEMLAAVPLSLGHPDDLPAMRESLAAVQKPDSTPTTLQYRLRAKDGTYRWFETHTTPIRDRSGKLLRFYTVARDVTPRVDLERKLEHAAITDELTGLLNRRGFMLLAAQEYRVAARQKLAVAIVYADLDGLKTINDQLGHEHGDEAIRQLATILRATFRESDVIARLGGDEFVVLAYDVDEARVEGILRRMQAAVADAAPMGPCRLAVSLGYVLSRPGNARSLDDLITQADQKMYAEKRARKHSA